MKDASAAPSKVSTSAYWRGGVAGAALSLGARWKRKFEKANAFIVDACLVDGCLGEIFFLLWCDNWMLRRECNVDVQKARLSGRKHPFIYAQQPRARCKAVTAFPSLTI